jgi:hypothetical protein
MCIHCSGFEESLLPAGKKVYCATVGWNVLRMSVEYIWPIVLFNSEVSLLFCLLRRVGYWSVEICLCFVSLMKSVAFGGNMFNLSLLDGLLPLSIWSDHFVSSDWFWLNAYIEWYWYRYSCLLLSFIFLKQIFFQVFTLSLCFCVPLKCISSM